MRRGPRWFAGSADAIFQNLNIIGDESPEDLCVFGADHIYRMDPRQMLEQHVASGAGVTVAAIRVPVHEANQFGIIEAGSDQRIRAFLEKPSSVPGLDDVSTRVFVSMGNYIFRTDRLLEMLHADAEDDSSRHDIGGDLIPRFVNSGDASFYDFADNDVPGATERDRPRALCRHPGQLLPGQYGLGLGSSRLQPLQPAVARSARLHPSCRPPSSSSRRMAAPGGRWTPWWAPAPSSPAALPWRSVLSPGVLIGAGAVVEDSVIMNGMREHRPRRRGPPGDHR